jgi:hypothetical protein
MHGMYVTKRLTNVISRLVGFLLKYLMHVNIDKDVLVGPTGCLLRFPAEMCRSEQSE